MRYPVVVAALLVAATAPPAASAQVVRGTVMEPDLDRPVAGAHVVLVDGQLVGIDSVTTDGAGRFRLRTPGGEHVLIARLDGYLTVSRPVATRVGETLDVEIAMPLVSVAASRIMTEAIDREAAFQLPLDELCSEPLRPWEAGVLLGVTRDARSLDPIPGALVTLVPEGAPPRTRVSTRSGAFWFCNVPPGEARLVVRVRGAPTDSSGASIRAGTISWYDGLVRVPR